MTHNLLNIRLLDMCLGICHQGTTRYSLHPMAGTSIRWLTFYYYRSSPKTSVTNMVTTSYSPIEPKALKKDICSSMLSHGDVVLMSNTTTPFMK